MHRRTYEIIGLKPWSEVLRYILIGLPFIVVGFLICYLIWWRKRTSRRQSDPDYSGLSAFGCLGVVLMFVGCLFLLPLIAWIEAVISGFFTVILSFWVVVIGVIGVSWVIGWIKGQLRR